MFNFIEFYAYWKRFIWFIFVGFQWKKKTQKSLPNIRFSSWLTLIRDSNFQENYKQLLNEWWWDLEECLLLTFTAWEKMMFPSKLHIAMHIAWLVIVYYAVKTLNDLYAPNSSRFKVHAGQTLIVTDSNKCKTEQHKNHTN